MFAGQSTQRIAASEKEEKEQGTAEVKGHVHHLQTQGGWYCMPSGLNNQIAISYSKMYQKIPESKMTKSSEAGTICDLLTRKGLTPRSHAEKRNVMYIQNQRSDFPCTVPSRAVDC